MVLATAERKEDLPDNVIQLETIKGGKEPPSGAWLKDMDVGTAFLSRRKSNSIEATRDFTVGEFTLYNKTKDGFVLLLVIEDVRGPPRPVWVDPVRFSNQMELLEVIKTNVFQQVNTEEENDGSGAIRSGGLPNDAPPEGEHPILPEEK